MKRLKSIILVLSLLCIMVGCKSQKERNDVNDSSICPYKKSVFELSHNDENKIGLPQNTDFEIGPNALCISDETVYFLNPLFSKVNAFNLKNDSIFSSKSFSELKNSEYSWIPRINDLAFFNDKLYVLNGTELIYVLNKNLELVKSITVGCYENKEFYKVADDEMLIYCYNNDSIIKIDKDDKISFHPTSDTFNLKQISNAYLGERYEYKTHGDSTYLNTQYGDLLLNEEIQDITLKYYQCKNFGFNSEYFVHFSIDPSENRITFYTYCFN